MEQNAVDVFLFVLYGLDAFGGFGEHIKDSAGAYGVIVEHVRFEAALEEGIFFLRGDFCHSNLKAIQQRLSED